MHRFAPFAALALASCATGVDSATDSTTPGYDAGFSGEAAAGDAGEAGPGKHDSGSAFDASSPGDSQAPGEAGPSGDSGSVADAGGGSDGGGPTDAGGGEAAPPYDGGCAGHGTTGALVTFDLSSQSGSEASAAATTVATGVTSGDLSRASGLTAVSGSGSINASGWPTASTADATKYFTFTVTPASGCTVSLTTLALDVSASSTGPTKADVATSGDSFATHTASFAGTATPTATLTGASGTGPIEVRVYGYAAGGSAGTFRIRNELTLSGTIE
jgi:hypothetical protein